MNAASRRLTVVDEAGSGIFVGVPYKATHILRKTCATALAKAGLGPWAIADHLGHAGTEMAKLYVDRHHARNDGVAAALTAYTAATPRQGNRRG